MAIALIVGNSRYHWAWLVNDRVKYTWDTPYLSTDDISRMMSDGSLWNCAEAALPQELQESSLTQVPIYLASVVPSQTEIWQVYPQVRTIELSDVPLANLYPTLGIDRALAGFAAGESYNYPVLVIDGGTALTLTGVDGDKNLVGGAILPGLKLQLQSLANGTAALPQIELPRELPPRWSLDTQSAIASGVLHTTIAGINDFICDWWEKFPRSQVIFTGGDGATILRYLQSIVTTSQLDYLTYDRDLIFQGIQLIRR